jgi:nucleotide sugar dehydrogenase
MTKASVVGLGYVGFPVLIESLNAGMTVAGIDVSPKIIELRTRELSSMVLPGKFRLSQDFTEIQGSDYIVICVPTPLTPGGEPDYSAVIDACENIGSELGANQTVILESTVGPGTTAGIVQTTLEKASGLRAGIDFQLAFSPERIDPSNEKFFLTNTPKVVGGLTPECRKSAMDFYSKIVEVVVPAAGLLEAETSKLLENMYRHVNISFINEFSKSCSSAGIDFREVIRLAATKPFGFQVFHPSAGAGGHCVPVDPNYFQGFLHSLELPRLRTIELANRINQDQPNWIASRIAEVCESQKPLARSLLILGLSYKSDIGDFRESRQLMVLDGLVSMGYSPKVHDFYLNEDDKPLQSPGTHGCEIVETKNLEKAIEDAQIIVLLQTHAMYLERYILGHESKVMNATGHIVLNSAWSI